MRNTNVLPVMFAALLCGGCGVFGADVPVDLAEQTIPGDPTAHAQAAQALALSMGDAPVMSFTSDQSATSAGVPVVLLKSVRMDITATSQPAGDTDCWDFVQGGTVFVESTRKGTALPRLQVATGTAPGCVKSWELTPSTSANLKPYADEGFRVTAEVMAIPPEDAVSFTTHITLRAALF